MTQRHTPALNMSMPPSPISPLPVLGRVAVLGATGMLGQALCQTARHLGVPLVGIARKGADHIADASDSEQLIKALDQIEPTVIINAAAQTSLDRCEADRGSAYRINADVVNLLANYCYTHGIKLVQISTDHYFTGDGNRLHDEHQSVRLLNTYASSKYAGEAFAATCPDSLIIRTNLVGFRSWPGQPTFVEWALHALKANQPLVMFDDFFTSSIDVSHFSLALFELIEKKAAGLLNLAARTCSSKTQFLTALAQALGLSLEQCRRGSVRKLSGAYRAESLGLDVSKAEALLQRPLPGMEEVIASLTQQTLAQCIDVPCTSTESS